MAGVRWARLRPALAGGLALAAIAIAFTLPAVRAAAREFLDLFRVQRFAAAPVDPERLDRLEQGGVDLKALVGRQVEVIEPAVEPETVGSLEEAAVLAGIDVRRPRVIPERAAPAAVAVGRPGAFRAARRGEAALPRRDAGGAGGRGPGVLGRRDDRDPRPPDGGRPLPAGGQRLRPHAITHSTRPGASSIHRHKRNGVGSGERGARGGRRSEDARGDPRGASVLAAGERVCGRDAFPPDRAA